MIYIHCGGGRHGSALGFDKGTAPEAWGKIAGVCFNCKKGGEIKKRQTEGKTSLAFWTEVSLPVGNLLGTFYCLQVFDNPEFAILHTCCMIITIVV